MRQRFEPLEHTADKGIRAYGSSLDELFENAAFGMFSLMADLEKYTPVESREIEVEAPEVESLLRTWLAELLYQFEVDRLLFVDFRVEGVVDAKLKAVARGLPFSDDIEWLGPSVKAVTLHDLCVRRMDERWEAQVIFDV
ncbi:MAG: archease [Armatimonadetes bacterium]|nr:archease [Armatimonadota bacterium]